MTAYAVQRHRSARRDKISISQGKLTVLERPVIPFIRGDGRGRGAASEQVLDAAVEKAYGGQKKQVAKDRLDNWLRATRRRRFVNISSPSKARSRRWSAAAFGH